MTDNTTTQNRTATPAWITWAILLTILLCAAAIRWRMLDVPLERDEGEYAYAGQLILEGVPPYREVLQHEAARHLRRLRRRIGRLWRDAAGHPLGVAGCQLGNDPAGLLLARQLVDDFTGLVAAACFGLLSVGLAVQGVFANAEHFVLPPAIAGLILLERAVASDRKWPLVISGLLLGSGICRQATWRCLCRRWWRLSGCGAASCSAEWRGSLVRGLLFGLAAATPYLLTCLIMAALGVFDNFWFWTFDYARAYVSQRPDLRSSVLCCWDASICWY